MERVSISLVIDGHKVHHENVVGVRFEAAHFHLEGGKGSAANLGDDHLGAQLVEFVPQKLGLEIHFRQPKSRVQRCWWWLCVRRVSCWQHWFELFDMIVEVRGGRGRWVVVVVVHVAVIMSQCLVVTGGGNDGGGRGHRHPVVPFELFAALVCGLHVHTGQVHD